MQQNKLEQFKIKFLNYRKIVIKIGSSLIAPDGMVCSTRHCLPIANFIRKCQNNGQEVTLVSSGAVAAGFNKLQPESLSFSIKDKQALAAIGQSRVINHWQKFFDKNVAQILLTADDIKNRKRANNAKNTLQSLHKFKCLPIVNENDTVAIEELRVGDNDNLAAQVASLIGADLLVILSDVKGFFDDNPQVNPKAKLLPLFTSDKLAEYSSMAKDSHNPQATGGMKTKLQAANLAAKSNIETIICSGNDESYLDLLENKNPGSWILISNDSTSVTLTKEQEKLC